MDMEISVNTKNDVMRERFLLGAKLTGKYGFPQLPAVIVHADGLRSVPFNLALKERNPKECICHFFIDDMQFERVWNNPDKYIPALQNFKYVCAPDFSFYEDMPLSMQIWQVYRSRALAWYLLINGVNVVPVAGWSNAASFGWCFDGLPQQSSIALSSVGCVRADLSKRCFSAGYSELIERVNGARVVLFGEKIVSGNVDQFPTFSNEIQKRIKGGAIEWAAGPEERKEQRIYTALEL